MILIEFIRKNRFAISVSLLLALSFILRFYNFENRWGLAYDQAYSAVLARNAVSELKLPLIGPFSSAGPMQTGGEWYWFVMTGTILNPTRVNTPWVFTTLLYVFFVAFMISLGREFEGKKFGILLGLLTCVSTAQIAQSVSLTNQSPLIFSSGLALWGMIKFLKTKKLKHLFLLAFGVSLGITFHFQGVALISLLIATILITRAGIRGILASIVGFFVPLIPLLIFDLQNSFINSKNIIQYYLHDQYQVSLDVLGRNWRTYMGNFWPDAWSHIIGGHRLIGFLEIALVSFATVYSFVNKKMKRQWLIVILSFIAMVSILRYIRTPLYDSYLVFLHPFVLLLTAWAIFLVYSKNKIVAFSLLSLILIFSLIKDSKELTYNKTNFPAEEAELKVEVLEKKYPGQKFSLFSYKYQLADQNLILNLFLDSKNLLDPSGRRIGIVSSTESAVLIFPVIEGETLSTRLLDLNSSTSAQLKKSDWADMSPEEIYRVTQQWYTK